MPIKFLSQPKKSDKNNPEYFFLKEVDSLALANVKKNLDTAYKKFFKHEAGHC